MLILVNGQKQDYISLKDRSLHYGDGVFETIAIHNGAPLAWQAHMTRLQQACSRLAIPCPPAELLHQESLFLVENQQQAVLKLIISRGEGGRGYAPPGNSEATRIGMLYPWPEYPADYQRNGIRAGVCETRLACTPLLAGIKHLNRLEQVMLKKEIGANYPEAVVLDTEDRVVEGIMSNLFLVENEHLITPALENAGVNGVIRACIIETARHHGMGLEVRNFGLEQVLEAEEMFFCNSIAGIWPVKELQGHSYSVGRYTRQLQQLLHDSGMIILQ